MELPPLPVPEVPEEQPKLAIEQAILKRLQIIRILQGTTAKEFCKQCKVARGHYSRLMHSQSVITIAYMEKLLVGLKITMRELLCAETSSFLDAFDAELIAARRALTPEQFSQVVAVIQNCKGQQKVDGRKARFAVLSAQQLSENGSSALESTSEHTLHP